MTRPLNLTRYPIADLNPYHRNPRRGDVATIARSLEVNGQYRPVVVNLGTKTGRPLEILAGNHTMKAAAALGWTELAATTVDVDDEAAARIVAADNRIGDLGGYDDEKLIGLLVDLDDLDGTGYTDDDLAALQGHTDEFRGDEGPPGADGDSQLAVLVTCHSEAEQERTYNELHTRGYQCKVVTV